MNTALERYISEHIDPQPDHLARIERLTNIRLVNGRMCSGHLQGRILKMLVEMIRPHRILELGTFSGFSALSMAEALGEEDTVDTIEVNDELEDFIRENLDASPHGKKVILHIGDAMKTAASFEKESFDLVFLDADKRGYPAYYPLSLSLLRPGGYLIADNTLWDGHVADPAKARDPQTHAIMEFNDIVAGDSSVEKVIIPVRDGLTIVRKKILTPDGNLPRTISDTDTF